MVGSLLSVFPMTTHFKGKWYVVFLFCITFCFYPGINHYLMFYLINFFFKKKLYQAFLWLYRINIKPFTPSNSLGTAESQYIYIYFFSPGILCMTPLRAACSCLLHSCCWGLPCVIILGFPFTSFLCGLRFPKNLPSSSLVYLLFWSLHPPGVSWKRKDGKVQSPDHEGWEWIQRNSVSLMRLSITPSLIFPSLLRS